MKGLWIVLVMLAGLWAVGCDSGPEKVEHPVGEEAWEMAHQQEVDDEQVVARVDGAPITVEDVEVAWREQPEWDARQVVEYLVEREMLAKRARSAGYHERKEVSFSRKQGMVAALLAAEIEDEAQGDDESRAREIERVATQRRLPAGIRVSQLVILVPDEIDGEIIEGDARGAKFDRSQQWAQQVVDELGEDVDDDDLRRMAKWLNEEVLPEPFEAVVNEHLRFPRDGEAYHPELLPEGWISVMWEFAEGAETVADEEMRGQLSDPVRTRIGWHLIRVLEVTQPREADADAVEAYVDRLLEIEAMDRKLREKMEEWTRGASIELYPERLGSAFEE